jgi:general secretion pathway protein I
MSLRVIRGFTLLEVLVALAVLAVALGAIIKAASESAHNVGYLKNKTLASWVAQNQINEILLAKQWPETGTRQGTAKMAGQEWRWEIRINNTSDKDLRRLDVTVNLQDESTPLIQLVAFKGRLP